ncbi:queuine tRNA-ribosyltransferase [Stygiolobus rod-shaped virus]|uniref:Queuine tRNA-ribosyltransferase n=1 Tax=Stygiolobus rod-shaped virus TaxID=537009 RepID=B6EFC0_9VIRU|nr:queuine tRNA-ribosyltransferase [Stygiolobus rod-shaped virus]CAQ58455.1 hypothetical protein [Stygiolobus rod-shaped virus]
MRNIIFEFDHRLENNYGFIYLVNQLNFTKKYPKYLQYKKFYVDSGGFQISSGKIKLTLEDVLEKYKFIEQNTNPIAFFSLDYPSVFSPLDRRNFEFFEKLYTSLETEVIPVVHIYPKREVDEALDFYKQYTQKIAFGGFVASSKKKMLDDAVYVLEYVRRHTTWLHLFGVPGARNVFFCEYVTQCDTSTHIHLMSERRILLPDGKDISIYDDKFRQNYEKIIFLLLDAPFKRKLNFYDNLDLMLANMWLLTKIDPRKDNKRYYLYQEIRKLSDDEIWERIKNNFKKQSNLEEFP